MPSAADVRLAAALAYYSVRLSSSQNEWQIPIPLLHFKLGFFGVLKLAMLTLTLHFLLYFRTTL